MLKKMHLYGSVDKKIMVFFCLLERKKTCIFPMIFLFLSIKVYLVILLKKRVKSNIIRRR